MRVPVSPVAPHKAARDRPGRPMRQRRVSSHIKRGSGGRSTKWVWIWESNVECIVGGFSAGLLRPLVYAWGGGSGVHERGDRLGPFARRFQVMASMLERGVRTGVDRCMSPCDAGWTSGYMEARAEMCQSVLTDHGQALEPVLHLDRQSQTLALVLSVMHRLCSRLVPAHTTGTSSCYTLSEEFQKKILCPVSVHRLFPPPALPAHITGTSSCHTI